MTIKKIKSNDYAYEVAKMLLEKELMHSGKYGHKVQSSKKAYKRSKEKKNLLKELDNYETNRG